MGVYADDPGLIRIAEVHADGGTAHTDLEREVFAALDRVRAALAIWGIEAGIRRVGSAAATDDALGQ